LAMSEKTNFAGPPLPTVLLVCPGGLEHGGGIGRQMSYFLQAYANREQRLRYRVVDSRGPWFLGSSPLRTCASLFYLGDAMLILLRSRLTSRSVAHVNLTGRGSTIRKIILSTLARAIGLRYILHIHDYDYAHYFESRGGFLKRRIAAMFRGAEAIIVLGKRDQEAIPKKLDLQAERVIVIHNAVPDPAPNRDRASREDEPCRLLFLGYLSARKGVPELLHALASPAMKQRKWHATLAGGGPIDEFRTLAKQLGVADRVIFPGWLDQPAVTALCAEADVLILPSHAEGLAMSVLEGLAHGLTVITTPVGAHPEVIEPDVSGIMVRPGDSAGLADALVKVIDDDALRARLSLGARSRFLEGFDVRRYAAKLEQLHSDLFALSSDQSRLVRKGRTS
jgi:glycosyltransferase involved in cell wall biosynthesis